MEKEQLKQSIIERIRLIEDDNRLNAIHTILNTLENEQLSFDNVDGVLEPEDFSGYIKEWLKNM